ncbi:MAG: hypothetical protein IPP48_03230 [Chitinophagaceae bacterium]|nr:hypothetical protein [Chitinophagaceae bacterium]
MQNTIESQRKKIKQYLQAGKAITPIDALKKFGCFRLGARIWELRKLEKLPIKTKMIDVKGKGLQSML